MTDSPRTTKVRPHGPGSLERRSDRQWCQVSVSGHFLHWLGESQISLAFSTYQTGKLFLVERKPDGTLATFERSFNHCMGLWASESADTLWLGSKYQLWRFNRYATCVQPHFRHGPTDAPTPDVTDWDSKGYDFVYLPRVGHTTGDLDVHDIAVDSDGRVIFVSPLFGCVATLSETDSFRPIWRPPFLTDLVPEDRCHLNGLALRDGQAAFATAAAATDTADGWRDHRSDGGVVIEIDSGQTVCRGLSMPHSPRWYRDRLWILNSGSGELGTVDMATGDFQPVAFCPGYLRGLSVIGDYAIVTVSKPRYATFRGLRLDQELEQRGTKPYCGVQIIDLNSGVIAHWLRIDSEWVTELYDVVPLVRVRQPMAIGFQSNEIERMISIELESANGPEKTR